jgi:acylphosphatase
MNPAHETPVARVHVVAQGLVQGVGFRWFVAREASSLGVAGWVRNLVDGTVELEAEGEKQLLDLLVGTLRRGPRSAQVTGLRIEWIEPLRDSHRFEVR